MSRWDPAAAIARVNAANPHLPVRRCIGCRHNLGDPLLAIDCPLFGMATARFSSELRCPKFEPRTKPETRQ